MSVESESAAPAPPRDAPAAPEGRTLAPGFAAGVLGGVAMAAWMVLSAAVEGVDPLSPLMPLGQTFAGGSPRGDGVATLLLGLAVHLLFSGAVGVLFAALLPADLEPRFACFMTMGYAWVVMGIMASSVLPAVNPALRAEMRELGGAWVFAYSVFGLTVGFAGQRLRQRRPRLHRRETQGRPRESHA